MAKNGGFACKLYHVEVKRIFFGLLKPWRCDRVEAKIIRDVNQQGALILYDIQKTCGK